MQSVASSNATTDWAHSTNMYNIHALIDILWCACCLFCIMKQINIMPVYLSGASCAPASNQSFPNDLAKGCHLIMQYNKGILTVVFANARNISSLKFDPHK